MAEKPFTVNDVVWRLPDEICQKKWAGLGQ